MNMAAIGFCCIDVYENIGKRYATGNGVDCIVHLARRGVSTAVVSVVGTDEYGGEMFDLCREYQMDTSHLQVKEGKTSVYRMGFEGRSGQSPSGEYSWCDGIL